MSQKKDQRTLGTITIRSFLSEDGNQFIECDFQDMALTEVFGMLEWAKFEAILEGLEKLR